MEKMFNQAIFKEMVLYITARCLNNPASNSAYLNKILYYSDFLWYGYTGVAMSNEIYVREKDGPIPVHLLETSRELEAESKLNIAAQDGNGKAQPQPDGSAAPSIASLTDEQKEFIDQVIAAIAAKNASAVSNLIAHQDLSWQYLSNGETIPYETVFFRRKNAVSEETMTWAKSVIGEYEETLRSEESVV